MTQEPHSRVRTTTEVNYSVPKRHARHVNSSFIHSSLKLVTIRMSINNKMDQITVAYPFNGIVTAMKKNQLLLNEKYELISWT